MTFAEVIENDWFKKGYKPPVFEQENVNLDDVNAIFNESAVCIVHFCFMHLPIFIDFLLAVTVVMLNGGDLLKHLLWLF